jgi:hypothetical protein
MALPPVLIVEESRILTSLAFGRAIESAVWTLQTPLGGRYPGSCQVLPVVFMWRRKRTVLGGRLLDPTPCTGTSGNCMQRLFGRGGKRKKGFVQERASIRRTDSKHERSSRHKDVFVPIRTQPPRLCISSALSITAAVLQNPDGRITLRVRVYDG